MNDEERFEHFRDVTTAELYPWQKRLLDQAENHPEKVDEAMAMLKSACKRPGKTETVGIICEAFIELETRAEKAEALFTTQQEQTQGLIEGHDMTQRSLDAAMAKIEILRTSLFDFKAYYAPEGGVSQVPAGPFGRADEALAETA